MFIRNTHEECLWPQTKQREYSPSFLEDRVGTGDIFWFGSSLLENTMAKIMVIISSV